MLYRSAYFKLIEECIAQIVLHRSGYDPDFRAKKFDVDVDEVTNVVVGKRELFCKHLKDFVCMPFGEF